MKKIINVLLIFMIMPIAFAQNGNELKSVNVNSPNSLAKVQLLVKNQIVQQRVERTRNRFLERHNFTCPEECTYQENSQNRTILQVKENKKFLFLNIPYEDEYIIGENGEVLQTKHNFWSRFFNFEKIEVEQ